MKYLGCKRNAIEMLGIVTIEMSTSVWVLSCVFCIALILPGLSRVQVILCLLISVSFSFSQLFLDLGYIVSTASDSRCELI